MKTVNLPVAYMPLVDAAPLIMAQEMGFAEAEGIALDLIAAPSWSSVRDMLAFGRVDAAHMLSPVPVAMAMGLGGVTTALSAVSVLSVNGNVIGVGKGLEAKLRADMLFDPGVDIGEGADRAGNGAGGDLGPRGLQARAVAVHLGVEPREGEAHGGGFGVDAVAAADAHGHLVLQRLSERLRIQIGQTRQYSSASRGMYNS